MKNEDAEGVDVGDEPGMEWQRRKRASQGEMAVVEEVT